MFHEPKCIFLTEKSIFGKRLVFAGKNGEFSKKKSSKMC
jgi:hypothetical protein